MQLPSRPIDEPRDPRAVAVDAVPRGRQRRCAGADDVVGLAVVALLSGGHLLVEGVPGTGKTLLAKSLAAAIGGRFGRVQCTPDLLPADVTGTSVYGPATGEWEFRAGPGVRERRARRRGEPRLAAHAGRAARADGGAPGHGRRRHAPAARPVLPRRDRRTRSGSAGTFPLPESQLDRFALVCTLGLPGPRRRARDPRAARAASTRSTTIAAGHDARRARGDDRRGAARALRAHGARLRARRRRRDARTIPASCSARRRARASACCTPRRRTRR